MAILICAATQSELDASFRGISAQPKSSDRFSYLKCGVGPDKSRARLHRYLEKRKKRKQAMPELIVSTGFAGALSAQLQIGDCVVADASYWVFSAEQRSSQVSDRAQSRFIHPHRVAQTLVANLQKNKTVEKQGMNFGSIVSGDFFFEHNVTQKMNLWELKAQMDSLQAYDMETAALFCEASCWAIPYIAVRVISDTESKPLPKFVADFSNAMASTSLFSTMRLAVSGFRDLFPHPVKDLSHLYRQGIESSNSLSSHWECITSPLLTLLKSREDCSRGLTLEG